MKNFRNIQRILLCFAILYACGSEGVVGHRTPHTNDSDQVPEITDDPPPPTTSDDSTKKPPPTTTTPEPLPISAEMGMFYFSTYGKLGLDGDAPYTVRVNVLWDEVENVPGTFNWSRAAVLNAVLKDPRVIAVPVIRVHLATSPRCGLAPTDLDRVSTFSFGNSYSESLQKFAKAFAVEYRDRVGKVVLENEMNDPNFWCSSLVDDEAVDDYLRILSTVKNAFNEAGSNFKLSDGGIQGHTLDLQIVDQYLKNNQPNAAVSFWARSRSETQTAQQLQDLVNQKIYNPATRTPVNVRSKALNDRGLWRMVDIANFHSYQLSGGLRETVKFIRDRSDGRPVMTNEVGIMSAMFPSPGPGLDRLTDVPTYAAASVQLFKKMVELAVLKVSPAIWFTVPSASTTGFNQGMLFFNTADAYIAANYDIPTLVTQLTGANIIKAEPLDYFVGTNVSTLNAVFKFLNEVPQEIKDFSVGTYTYRRFSFSNVTVDILWSDVPVAVQRAADTRTACVVFDHHGKEVTGADTSLVAVTDEPVVVRCVN